MLQVDKGFMISNECAQRHIYLSIPPGLRGGAQFANLANRKTTRVANTRILVEQVIGRMKKFNIINGTVPLSLVPSLDPILDVIAGVVNTQNSIYNG